LDKTYKLQSTITSKAIIKEIQEKPQESRKEWLLNQFETPEGYRFWRGDNKPIEL